MQCYISLNLMKKQAHLHLGWSEGEHIFIKCLYFGVNYSFHINSFTHLHVVECSCCSFQSVPYMHKSYALILRWFFPPFWRLTASVAIYIHCMKKTKNITKERKSFRYEIHDINHRIFMFAWSIPLHLIDFWVNNLFEPLICPRTTELES